MMKLPDWTRSGALLWLVMAMMVVVACGTSDEQAAVEDAVEQVAEVATKVIAERGEVDDSWPFTLREVDALRITSRTEDLVKQSYRETILEYVKPDRTRDVTTIVAGSGEEPTVAERISTTEHSYLWVAGKLMTMDATQDPVALIDDALRLNTSAGRLEDAHKMRQFMQEMEGREDLDGKEMLAYYHGDLDVLLGGEQVKGFSEPGSVPTTGWSTR